MCLAVETERETDGRRIGEVAELPGALAYGATESETAAKAQALALRILADRLDHGENNPLMGTLSDVSIKQLRERHIRLATAKKK